MSRQKGALRSTVESWLTKNGYQAPNRHKVVQAYTDHWTLMSGQDRTSLKMVGVHLSAKDATRLKRHLKGKGYSDITIRTSTSNMVTRRGTEYFTGLRVLING